MTGKEEAEFTDFVSARGTALLRLSLLLTGNRDDAQDLLQVALLRLAQHWSDRLLNPDAYVRTCLINLNKDRLRLRLRLARRVHDSSSSVPDIADSATSRQELLQALRALPVRQRTAVVLRYLEGYSEEETAALMGCGKGTVKSHGSRGLSRLRLVLTSGAPGLVSQGSEGIRHERPV